MINGKQKQTTAGSLLEQAANAEMQIAAARRANGCGYEVSGIGGNALVAWSRSFEAVFAIAQRAIDAALNPGKSEDVEAATQHVGRNAVVTREAVRDTIVLPLRGPTLDAISKAIATGMARVDTRNAEAACQAIVRRIFEEVEHLRRRIEAGVAQALSPSRLLESIDEAVHASEANLATLASSLRQLKARAEVEPARIDEDLRASTAALSHAEEHLRVIAQQTKRARMFGGESAVAQVVREVHISFPKLTDERLSQMYLPAVRDRLPAVSGALADRADGIETRLQALRQEQERLRGLRGEESARLSGNGRIQLVGIPASEASRRAAVQQVIDAVYAGIHRELRDIIVWEAPQERILDEVLALVRARVEAQAPMPSIDEVLLRDVDPRKLALELDRIVRESEVPVALEPGADRLRIRDWRCRVIRVPAGSSVAQAMIDHAGYRSDAFEWTGRPDRIEIIVLQKGISLRDTRLCRGDDLAYREEQADAAAPPIETLCDSVLRGLVRRSVPRSPSRSGGDDRKGRAGR